MSERIRRYVHIMNASNFDKLFRCTHVSLFPPSVSVLVVGVAVSLSEWRRLT